MAIRIAPIKSQSQELASMESELRFLLTHSNLTEPQRAEFMGLLSSVFDLFLTPVQESQLKGYSTDINNSNIALMDIPNVELFSKMQSLVSALTVLIMNEDDDQNMSYIAEETASIPNEYNQQLQSNYALETPTSIESRHYESRVKELDNQIRSPLMIRKSPSFHSENLPLFRDHSQSYRTRSNHSSYHQQLNDRYNNEFKVVNTPVPRTFSVSSSGRPQSVQYDKLKYTKTPTPSSSPSIFNKEGSNSGGSTRKRYSMRF